MKASLRLRGEDNNHQNQNKNPLLLRLKLPMNVLGFPFISSITGGGDHPTDLSLNLRTNCFNGPSLKLSYSPNTTNPHLSLSLKSGVGLFGSPNNSPLIMSAQFNLFGTPNPNPIFFLQIKPQFGDFFLSKTAVSAYLHNPNPPNFPLPKENGAVHDPIRDLRGGSDGIFSGVAVTAKTILPVTKRAEVKFRWGVNFTTDSEEKLKLPFLTIDKVSVERVEKEEVAEKVVKSDGNNNVKDLELMKGMCCLMRREVEDLQRENSLIKERLNEVRLGKFTPIHSETSNFASKKAVIPLTENSTGFDRWRSKKNGADENGRRDLHNVPSSGSEDSTNDVEEELKKAIKAASS